MGVGDGESNSVGRQEPEMVLPELSMGGEGDEEEGFAAARVFVKGKGRDGGRGGGKEGGL